MTVRAEEIIECYGKYPVKDGIDRCARRAECPWGESCLSRSREGLDAMHYHIANVSVGFLHYDSGADDDGSERMYANDTEEIEAKAEQAIMNQHSCEENEEQDLHLDGITIPGAKYGVCMRVIERIAQMYFSTPSSFDMLMKSVFKGKNQSDVAKEEGITRQGLNKRLLYELGIAQKRNDIQQRRDRELNQIKMEYSGKLEELRELDAFFRSLSERDWRIYRMVFLEKKSYSKAAREIGCSLKTVYRVSKVLRSKMDENVQIDG